MSISKAEVTSWLSKQAASEVHQFDLLYMPHNTVKATKYEYTFATVDVPWGISYNLGQRTVDNSRN